MTRWRNRIVGHGEEAPDQLLANPGNWRVHPKAQQAALAGAISDIGFIRSVTVNRTSGHVIDGHLRVALALRNGEAMIPVEYVEMTEAEETEALLTLDPIAAMASADKEKLDALLRDVATGSEAVQAMLAELAAKSGLDWGKAEEADAEPQVDRAAELQALWQTEVGDLWQIGDHRLACGDCTDKAVVERVMGEERAALMLTDPPYGVEYDPMFREEALGAAVRRTGRVENDTKSDWREAWHLFAGDVAYCWSGMLTTLDVLTSFEVVGFSVHSEIVWAKPHVPFGRGHYTPNHESCWYLVRKGATCGWIADGVQKTVWDVALDETVTGGHGTQKPLECMSRPIRNHNAGIIYDPFLGSGTTMVACQNLGRKCRGIEISPGYTAVCLQRMQDAFGITGTRIVE